MDYQVVITAQAERDLFGIVAFLAEANPAAAERLGHALPEAAESLGSLPYRGPAMRGRHSCANSPTCLITWLSIALTNPHASSKLCVSGTAGRIRGIYTSLSLSSRRDTHALVRHAASMTEKDWDRLAAVYAKEVCDIFARDRRGVIGRWLQRRRLLDRKRTALDLGCGIGSFFKKYGAGFGAKIGTDHSRRMLQIAAPICHRQPEIQWLQADVKQLPAALHGCGDLVVCSNVITFVSLPQCRRALAEVVRTAKPRGWVMLVQPALESHDAVVTIETGRPASQRKDMAVVRRDDRKQRFFTRAGAARLAKAAGLQSVSVDKVWYPWSDDGITHPPRGQEPPWDWLVTGRRR